MPQYDTVVTDETSKVITHVVVLQCMFFVLPTTKSILIDFRFDGERSIIVRSIPCATLQSHALV